MTTNIIWQKDKKGNLGYIYVTFSQIGEKPVRKSTKHRITKEQFITHRNKEQPIFNVTKLIDYQGINNKIFELVKINPYSPKVETDFIKYFEQQNNLEIGGTKSTYDSALIKLKGYYPTLSFTDIDQDFLKKYKTQLDKEGRVEGYIRQQLIIICNRIKKANKNKKLSVNIDYDLKDMGLTKTVNRKDVLLSTKDIQSLIKFPIDHKNIEYVTFALVQLFSNGSRFSDLILLKMHNFKPEGIIIQQPKTKKFIKIPYSIMLLRVLYRFIHRNNKYTDYIYDMTDGKLNNDELGTLKQDIFRYVTKYDKGDCFWSFVPEGLRVHESHRKFNDVEFPLLVSVRNSYNGKLRVLRKNLEMSVDTLSSHSFRYKFVHDCLFATIPPVPIYQISKCLNHSSVDVTESYIRKHFGVEDNQAISNVMDSLYLDLKDSTDQ